MSAPRNGVVPILPAVTQSVGHLVFRLYRHPCGTIAFSILSEMQARDGRPAEFTGIVDATTPGEMRLFADAMEGLLG